MDVKSIAKIGKGTRRKKRDINLLDVALEIKYLYKTHKSLEKVARIVKLSSEMVREFLKVTELNEKVKELINDNLIKGVDIAYRISKLSEKEQLILAKHIIRKSLSSDDVRAIIKYKTDNPTIPIEKAANKVIRSKTQKIYVAFLGIEKDVFEELLKKTKDKERIVRSFFNRVVSRHSIKSFELNGRVAIIKVSKEGLLALRSKAKELEVPLAKLGNALVKEYLQENKQ